MAKHVLKKVTREDILNSLCAPLAEACRKHDLNVSHVVKAVKDGLEAEETKTSYDKDRGKWVYSLPLIDHGRRLEAANVASSWFGLKREKKEHSGNINVIIHKDGRTPSA